MGGGSCSQPDSGIAGCGGDFNSATGTFSSPNYPQAYPHNRECVWRITVEPGKRIQLNLVNVDLEFHSDCNYDFLEVSAAPYNVQLTVYPLRRCLPLSVSTSRSGVML